MQLPFFFEEDMMFTSPFSLSENSSRHIVQVLRMKEGEKIQLTNGKGYLLTAEITKANKKSTEVTILEKLETPQPSYKTTIAISFIKNANRFEWFLEKATEIGITDIVPIICHRTEKIHFREERMKQILVSAMLQSRQVWLPNLTSPIKIKEFIKTAEANHKLIAHCEEKEKKELIQFTFGAASRMILIGPEGDFTSEEIEEAIQHNFIPVSLGETRLRTETAALVAAVLLINL
ncbi:MAG: RsmE family RNA methyltransferase [Ginsengibacter sp.]|jgi:16S rRNA (uracil1498-N3)-methyltransferase